MSHPHPESSFRVFECAFLLMTIAASVVLTCVLVGVPRLFLDR